MGDILAVDLGSTQMKLMIMDENADVKAVLSEKYPTKKKYIGWLEQDPADWEKALQSGIVRLRQKVNVDQISVISFSGHMSGIVLVDCQGNVLCPCIMLSDNRSQKQSDALMRSVGEEIRDKTGNPINNAFSLPKLCWIREERPEIYRQTAAWMSPKDYMRYCLTQEVFTEYTDAANSLCIRSKTVEWDSEMIRACKLTKDIFPSLRKPIEIVGKVTGKAAKKYGLKEGIPVAAGAADMACAVLGSGLSKEGDAALTLGTCATFFSVVSKPDRRCYGQVTFHPLITGEKMYALGSHMNGGAAVNWISSILSEAGEINYEMITALSERASYVPVGCNGIMTIPFLNGSGSPYFCASDRQHVIGMKMNTTREEIFRSQLEGVAYNLRQSLLVFRKMADIKKMMLAGGGIHVKVWTAIIRDVFGIPVEISEIPDVSTVGAALIGGTAAGIFHAPEELARKKRSITETQFPDKEKHMQYEELYKKYLKYYGMLHKLDMEEFYGQETCI